MQPTTAPRPFDLHTIKVLASLMSRHDLSEIDLQQGDQRIRLRRGVRHKSVPLAFASPAPATPALLRRYPRPDRRRSTRASCSKSKVPRSVRFMPAPSLDAPQFVTVGSKVTPTSVVGIIEAMKMFNEIDGRLQRRSSPKFSSRTSSRSNLNSVVPSRSRRLSSPRGDKESADVSTHSGRQPR